MPAARFFILWYFQDHGGPSIGLTGNPEFSSKNQSPLLHAQNSEGFRVLNFTLRDSPAVVPDFQEKTSVLFPQKYGNLCCTRVSRHIGQRFLKDAKHGSGCGLFQVNIVEGCCELKRNPCTTREFLFEPELICSIL